jgi:coproporphyrinogen III oxidase
MTQPLPKNFSLSVEEQQSLATAWFRTLRDLICAEFEKIEQEYTKEAGASKFIRTPWTREGGGGGEMSVLKGRVFEKVGVNISTVHGEFSEAMRKEIPGAAEHPEFWASGISVVAHMCSPLVPAVHMNTRMIVVGKGAKQWFGGGSDLTPMYPNDKDTADFHGALKQCCDRFDPGYYAKFKKWCDEYFFLKHRSEPRGVGGIFYDYVNSGDWQKDFEFTQSVGETFLDIYPKLVRRHMHESWTPEQREHQLKKRGRYVEFNLLYDRGTRFGLMTGGNVEAILMSLPPEVKWP